MLSSHYTQNILLFVIVVILSVNLYTEQYIPWRAYNLLSQDYVDMTKSCIESKRLQASFSDPYFKVTPETRIRLIKTLEVEAVVCADAGMIKSQMLKGGVENSKILALEVEAESRSL